MMEREALQYDIRFDSQRFTTLYSNGATQQEIEGQKAYIQRQLETDIGERLHRAESHYIYELKGGILYGQGESEPFLDVVGRGVVQRSDGTRENAELIGMRFIESYLADAPDGATVFFPSPAGGVYAENYLHAQRKVGNTIHAVTYLSTRSNEEYRQKILEINPAYADVIPENPKDIDFLLNPVVVPSHLDLSPDDLAEFVLGGKNGMQEEEFERIKTETASIWISYILHLANHPEDVEGLKLLYKAGLAATRQAKDGGYTPTYSEPEDEIHYLSEQKETLGGGGCGSGACSVDGSKGPSDEKGPLKFNCPSCGVENTRPYGGYVYRCENKKCKNPEAVLPQSMRNNTIFGLQDKSEPVQ